MIGKKNSEFNINKSMEDNRQSMFSAFPIEQFRRMVLNIDRFDTDMITDEKIVLGNAEDKINEISDKIIEENL